MFAFAPPVKVPRTQRQSIIHAAEEPLTSSRSHQWGEAAPQVHPSYMEDAVLRVGTCGGTMAEPSRYLSGVGTHMCWHIDENQRLVRLWNLSSASWKRTEPRMAELPYFAAAEEGLPLFVCEMDDAEESLAFCSERGAISSLDHSVEFKLLDDGPHEEYLAASSFACVRRIAADGESMVYTAVGTTAGNIIVDVKRRGEHLTSLVEGRSLLTSSEGSANRVGPSRWWSSMKSFVGASPSGSHHSQDGERGISPVSKLCFRRGSTATPLLWAATAAAEIACVDFDALQRGEGPRSLRPLWTMNLNNALALHEGVILSMSISTKRIFVLLWSQPPPESRSLPSLILATLNAESGAVVNYLTIHTVADVVHAAREVPQQHIRVVGNDEQSEVFIFIKQFCVRVNNEIGARHPCASEDTIVLRRLVQPMGTVMMGDGSIIALDVEGPVVAVENIFADVSEQTEEAHTPTLTFTGRAAALTWGDDADTQRCLTDLLRGVRTDQKLTLDEAVLQTSEEIVASCKPNEGNWARANLDSEDENIVLHVTRQLKRRQQSHRRFLIAVLQHEDMMAELAPTTIAQLVSTQEALLVLSALRSMQNVGMTVSSLSLDTYQQVPLMAGMMHEDVARGSHAVPLMVSAEHLSRCQQMLRLCVVSVAQEQRRASASSPEVLASTAAELCFSHPSMAVQLLRAIGEHLMQVRSTVAVGAVDKFISSHAAAAIFVVSAQTIIESREDLKQIYAMPTSTERFLWTASSDSVMGVELSFTHLEGLLADALSDLFLATAVRNSSPSTPSPRSATLLIPQSEQLAFLDLITYLLFFSCVMHGRSGDHAFYSNLLTRTLLRAPLVASPFGYPHGAPQPVSAIGELSQRALRVAERFALTFDAVEVLLGMSLASPVSDPYEHPEMYAKLELYCLQNPRMLRFAMDGLWRSGREWELLALPAALTRIDGAAAERDRFLSEFAPHLLWLANPSRFDALLAEGSTCPPVVAFGPTQLSHRSRCAALARLAWIADGASTSTTAYAELELETRMSTAQTTFLASTSSGIALGPQEIVQRLLQLEDSPAAWLAAAQVAELIRSNVSDDLLGQVIKRCKAHDGPERLMKIHRDSVSELETSAALRATAVGQLLSQCSAFKNPQTLHRVGAVALTNDELRLLSSWLATLWTGESVREA